MLWSGSSIWFLIAGILMVGSAAVMFLARRDAPVYGYQTLSPEPNRLPLVLLGLGVLFLAMLIVPSVSSSSPSAAERLQRGGPQAASTQPALQPTATHHAQSTARPTARATAAPTKTPVGSSSSEQVSNTNPPAGSQTYTVKDGDTLWDIAQKFSTTVADIVAANHLASESDLQLGQELIIPASANATTGTGGSTTASEPEATPSQ